MAYQKTVEEQKWLAWKKAEEQQMRSLGFEEQKILELRKYDWDVFNSDRRFYQRVVDFTPDIDITAEPVMFVEVRTAQDLLNSIDCADLHNILAGIDSKTMGILLMRLDGYSIQEIAKAHGLSQRAVYWHIKMVKDQIRKEVSL